MFSAVPPSARNSSRKSSQAVKNESSQRQSGSIACPSYDPAGPHRKTAFMNAGHIDGKHAAWRSVHMRETLASCLLSLLLLSACGGPRPPPQTPAEFHPARSIIEHYDASHDGMITRAEVEQGLRAEFAQADAKH